MAQRLMGIAAAKAVVARTPLSVAAEAELRQRARLRSTHYSTRIEGNRLTLEEAERAITQARMTFSGREPDVREVRNYWQALLRVETWASQGQSMLPAIRTIFQQSQPFAHHRLPSYEHRPSQS